MANVQIETNDKRLVSGTYNWIQVALIGAATGIIVWGLSWLLGTYVFEPIFCREAIESCSSVPLIAYNVAAILGALIAFGVFLRLRLPRAIVIVLATLVTLWGLSLLTYRLSWAEAAGWSALLYALAYTVFTLLSRVRNGIVLAIVVVIIVVVARLIVS